MTTATFVSAVLAVVADITLSLLALWALAGLGFFLIYVAFRRYFRVRKIQDRDVDRKAFRSDVKWSAWNVGATAVGSLGTTWLLEREIIRISQEPLGWQVMVGQFLLYFVLFDLFFYVEHRILHTDWLYRHVHRYHHVSTSPTPLTAFAFHPAEALVSNYFVTFLLFFVDLHLYTVAAIYGYGVANSILVHCGHEVFPRWWFRSRWSCWYLTPTWHDHHHQGEVYNFGGFTTVWDRLFGTAMPGFEAAYDGVKAKLGHARYGPRPGRSDEPSGLAPS